MGGPPVGDLSGGGGGVTRHALWKQKSKPELHVGSDQHVPNVTAIVIQGSKLAPGHIPNLKEHWVDKINDLISSAPLRVPPLRMVNHEINLIDPDKHIHYHLPKCPDALKTELTEKISRYISAGWWVPTTVHQAVPMLCVLKKNGKLQTVFDLCQQTIILRKMYHLSQIRTRYGMM